MTNVVEYLLTSVKTKLDLDNVINLHGLNYQDSHGESYLHELSRKGNLELVVYLFDRKRTEKYNINLKNNLGRTALFDVLNEEIAEFLLLHQIDYKHKDNQGKMAEEVNDYVNFCVNQKCNDTKKRILKSVYKLA